MNLLLFIVVLLVSLIVVRIGAIAFHLTGLDWSLAKFQALSCFTGTGFTTRESELITTHSRRRQIASILMVLGNAGLVTLIATFANSLRPNRGGDVITLPWTHLQISEQYWPWLNLLVIIAFVAVLYRGLSRSRWVSRMTVMMKERLLKKMQGGKNLTVEELTIATGGYSVMRIPVCQASPIAGRTLAESGLKAQNIILLAIVRDGQTLPNPTAAVQICDGDELICFGSVENMRSVIRFQ